MNWTGLIYSLLVAAPFIVFLVRINYREYGGLAGNLWNQYGEDKLDRDSKRFICAGIYAGLITGYFSTGLVMLCNQYIFGSDMLLFQPTEPVAWTLQIAFIQAGLVEELAKCGLALLLCWLIAFRNNRKSHRSQPFLKSAPLICAAVGLGFAIRENVDYISLGLNLSGIVPVVLGRIMASIAHMLFVLNFGLYLYTANQTTWKANIIKGFLISVGLHGLYDFFAFPPVMFSSFLTYLFLLIMAFFIMRRFYKYFPDKKPVMTALATSKKTVWQDKDHNGVGKNVHTASPDEFNYAIQSGYQKQKINLHRNFMNSSQTKNSIELLCEPLPGFLEISDHFRSAFSQYNDEKTMLYDQTGNDLQITELASVLGLGSKAALFLGCDQYRGAIPEKYQTEWANMENFYGGLFGNQDESLCVWDSSVFAQEPDEVYLEMRRAGVDLETLSPFRVWEFAGVKGKNGLVFPYLYITAGLKLLYGHEFCFVFFTPMPAIRWFLLRLASVRPDQAPWIREWVPMYVGNSSDMGEPRGWWKGFLPVPLFGELRATIANPDRMDDHDFEAPLAMLLLSISDLAWITKFGLESFFVKLEQSNISRHNHLKKPVLTGG